jgi:hypothetical protein
MSEGPNSGFRVGIYGFSDAVIAYTGAGLATVASRGCWELKLIDIWDGCSKYGLDAWELRDTIFDPDDEDCAWIPAAVSVVKDVAVLGLSQRMEYQSSWRGSAAKSVPSLFLAALSLLNPSCLPRTFSPE